VTGFSLLGHGMEMAEASGVGLQIEMEKMPFVRGAEKYAGLWTFPGGAHDNRQFYGAKVHFSAGIPEEKQMLLFDPQTSGGLLLSVPRAGLQAFLARCKEAGQDAWVIGEVVFGAGIDVR